MVQALTRISAPRREHPAVIQSYCALQALPRRSKSLLASSICRFISRYTRAISRICVLSFPLSSCVPVLSLISSRVDSIKKRALPSVFVFPRSLSSCCPSIRLHNLLEPFLPPAYRYPCARTEGHLSLHGLPLSLERHFARRSSSDRAMGPCLASSDRMRFVSTMVFFPNTDIRDVPAA